MGKKCGNRHGVSAVYGRFRDGVAEARPVGRPAKLWRLTLSADKFFPDGHADLTLGLIDAMRSAFGETGMDRSTKKNNFFLQQVTGKNR